MILLELGVLIIYLVRIEAKLIIESLLMSDKVKKINMFNWVQERIIIVTSEYLYNIKKNKIKRKIAVSIP